MATHSWIILICFLSTVWCQCPPEFVLFGENCYHVSNSRWSFATGRSLCQSRKGELLSINSVEERDFIKQYIMTTKQHTWIGANDDNGQYEWLDGSTPGPLDPDISEWEPNKPTAGQCAYFKGITGEWSSDPCTWTKVYACKRHVDVHDLCDYENDWHSHSGTCWRYYDNDMTYNDARAVCQGERGDLAVVDTNDKFRILTEVVHCKDYEAAVWIGLSDIESSSPEQLQWVDGSTLGSTTNWLPGQPTFPEPLGNNCVEGVTIAEYQWSVDTCSKENKFVCEKPEGSCPTSGGWQDYGTQACYQVISNPAQILSFSDAADFCTAQGGQLIKIVNDQQQAALIEIAQTLRNDGIERVRIGLSDMQSDGVFRWTDGTSLGRYDKLEDDFHENTDNRWDCGYVQTGDSEGKWGTTYCFDKQPFICEIPKYTQPMPYTPDPDIYTCPEGWENQGPDCFYFGEGRTSMDQALSTCSGLLPGAELLKIDNPKRQSFINSRLRDNTWVGLRYRNGRYEYDDGSLPNFANWREGGQDNGAGEPCSRLRIMIPVGEWTSEPCDHLNMYICWIQAESDVTGTTLPPTPPFSAYCGVGWVYDWIHGYCYKLRYDVTVTWSEAHEACLAEGGGSDLVSIRSLGEQGFINAMIASTLGAGNSYWLGLNDLVLSEGWRWTDGSPLPFFNWAPGEPNNDSGEEWCNEMSTWNQGKWNDIRCNALFGFICKKPSENVSTPPPPSTTQASQTCVSYPLISGSRYVSDHLLRAASSEEGRGPEMSRSVPDNTISWTAATNGIDQYLEVRLWYTPKAMIGIITYGAPDREQWVTSYRLRTRLSYNYDWTWITGDDGETFYFSGNVDSTTAADNLFNTSVVATYWRLYPQTWNGGISVRWELFGCRRVELECDKEDIVSGEAGVVDDLLTSSSYKQGYEPYMARLSSGTGWAPVADSPGEWLQLDFEHRMTLHEIQVWGRADNNHYVTKYKVYHNYYRTNEDTWEYYADEYGMEAKVFDGPSGPGTSRTEVLRNDIAVIHLRLEIVEWVNGIGMRLEVVGCRAGCQPQALIDGDNHKLADSYLSASSAMFPGNSGAARSRLYTVRDGELNGGWIPANSGSSQFLQLDLGYTMGIDAVATQGLNDEFFSYWVTNYTLSHSRSNNWYEYTIDGESVVLEGNYDKDTVRKHYIRYPFTASRIRLFPQGWNDGIGMRWEVYGCPGSSSHTEVGCFADNQIRDLPHKGLDTPTMTREICTGYCFRQDYAYAGVQFGAECFCGNSYGSFGPSGLCDMQCKGDASEICGGEWSNNILTTGLSPYNQRCADGWVEYNDKCWLFMDTETTWQNAEGRCIDEKAELATINSQGENDFVTSRLALYDGRGMWIGLHCQKNNYFFEWISGEVVYYTNWDRREPNSAGQDEDCVMVYPRGTWNDDPCSGGTSKQFGYICQKNKEVLPLPPTTTPSPGCGDNFVSYRWKCYTIILRPDDWERQRENCEGLGGRLARVEDEYEQAFLAAETAKAEDGFYWTDLNDRSFPGTYTYSNGEAPSYTHWASGQPDRTWEPSCVAIGTRYQSTWYDENCYQRHTAVCEKDSTTVTRPTTAMTNPPQGGCVQGWTSNGNWCYRFVDLSAGFKQTFDEAHFSCTQMGADLVSVHSADENDFIYRFGVLGKNGQFWLGLNDRGSGYQWTDGTEVAYLNWDLGQPNGTTSESCAEISHQSGRWTAIPCGSTRNYICKIPQGVTPQVPTSTVGITPGPPGSCSPDNDDWKFYNNRCYYVSGFSAEPAPTDAWLAEAWCRQNGGYLVSIHDDDTTNFIQGLVGDLNYMEAWIGLNKFDGSYKWSDESVVDYTNWANGEPDETAGTKLCAVFNIRQGSFGAWIAKHCSSALPFICAKNQGGTTITTPRPTPRPGNCPQGYEAYEDKCYQFVNNNPVTWSAALTECRNDQGTLATIQSLDEQAFITAHLLDNAASYWIGLHQFEDHTFGWADNSQFTVAYWGAGEPNGGLNEQCVHVVADRVSYGRWNDNQCEILLPYICMKYKDESNASPEPPPNPCTTYGENYIPYNGDCYKMSESSTNTWQEAENECKTTPGGHLISIITPYEMGFIYSIFAQEHPMIDRETATVWTGLSDSAEAGRYVWSDGWTVTYTNWGSGQPDNPDGGCVYFRYEDSRWVNTDCNSRRWHICKVSDKTPEYTRPPPGGCPSARWLEFGDSCYLFEDRAKTFADARFECNIMNADVVSIHSQEENDFIETHIVAEDSTRWWWLGLVESPTNGWTWSDGSESGFFNWYVDEPSNLPEELCVEMYTFSGQWNDIKCDVLNSFVCKIKQSDYTPPTSTAPIPGVSTPLTSSRTPPTSPTLNPGTTPPVPSVEDPGRGSSSGLSAGGAVGVAFTVIFIALVSAALVLIVFRRQGRSVPILNIDNPSYGKNTEA